MGSNLPTGLGPTAQPILIPRLRSSLRAVDTDGFFSSVEEALALEVKVFPPPDGAHPVLVHSFPKERIAQTQKPFDVVTWRILSSGMAPTDNAGSRIPRKTVLTVEEPSLQLSGYNELTHMWWELATVEFTIWSRSSDTRSTLTTWFHKFLMRYANVLQFFEGRGIDKFQFVGRGEDEFSTREQQEVHSATLTYQFRVQYLDRFTKRQLEELTVHAQIDQRDQHTLSIPADAAQ